MSVVLEEAAAARMGEIIMRQGEICFGEGKHAVRALQGVDLHVTPGEFVTVLGPSGCGKSTLIGAIAGITPLSAGELLVDGLPIRKPGFDRGVVFQQHTLFPWKTVLKNVAFGLKMRGVERTERTLQAKAILASVGLGDFFDHYPAQLSGGMQQRVSLARVLVNRPRVLLMDEPFSALDSQTRLQMQELLLSLWAAYGMTVVFVTHDIDEAIFLSDRIVVIGNRPGRVIHEFPVLIERPRTAEVLTSGEFNGLKRKCMDLIRTEAIGGWCGVRK